MNLLFTLLSQSKLRHITLKEMHVNEHHLKHFKDLMLGNKKVESISLQHNDIRMDGCLYIA